MITEIEDAFSSIFEKDLIQEIVEVGTIKTFLENDCIIEIGDNVSSMPLLITGAIKILREDSDGDELLLYFLEKGDTCAMTLSCCLGHKTSEIRAIAEMETKLIMVPVEKMEEWTSKYKSWRDYVFQSYHTRFSELLDTIDTIAFLNMDERLLKYLRDKAKINQNEILQITHQQIAYDLHTSRVVISRLLKKLEIKGKISLQRNNIQVIDL